MTTTRAKTDMESKHLNIFTDLMFKVEQECGSARTYAIPSKDMKNNVFFDVIMDSGKQFKVLVPKYYDTENKAHVIVDGVSYLFKEAVDYMISMYKINFVEFIKGDYKPDFCKDISYVYYTDGKRVWVKVSSLGDKTFASCNKNDKFSLEKGLDIALARALYSEAEENFNSYDEKKFLALKKKKKNLKKAKKVLKEVLDDTCSREFKVGDKVRIRQWEDMKKEFGMTRSREAIDCKFTFTEAMKHLCGKVAVVCSADSDGRVALGDFEDVLGKTYWSYSTDMIEHV